MSQCDFLTIVKINLNFHIITNNVPLYLGIWLCISRFQIYFFQIMLLFFSHNCGSLPDVTYSVAWEVTCNVTLMWHYNSHCKCEFISYNCKYFLRQCNIQEIKSKSINIKQHCNYDYFSYLRYCLTVVTLFLIIDPLQGVWLTGDLTNHYTESAILSDKPDCRVD